MVEFKAVILKFASQGEKTGWSYIKVPVNVAQQLIPGNKKAFRVKGKLDDYSYAGVSLIPMGGGDFIMALNATVRKAVRKSKGASLQVKMEVDDKPVQPPAALIECLADEPKALKAFNGLAKSHQNYFTKWIETAKTENTQAKRIAQAVNALASGLRFNEMIRKLKEDRKNLLG